MVVAIVGTNLALAAILGGFIFWAFSKFDSDIKTMGNRLDSDMKSFANEIRGWKDEIYKEMKDFHGRLCSLEEKNKSKTDP